MGPEIVLAVAMKICASVLATHLAMSFHVSMTWGSSQQLEKLPGYDLFTKIE